MSGSTPIPEPTEFWVTSPDEGQVTPESRARRETALRWLSWKYQFFRELRSLNLPEPVMVLPDEKLPSTSRTTSVDPPRDDPDEIVPIIVDGRN